MHVYTMCMSRATTKVAFFFPKHLWLPPLLELGTYLPNIAEKSPAVAVFYHTLVVVYEVYA